MPPKKQTRADSKAKKTNQLRIIAGKWRSRRLHFPNTEGLRPTGNRIRETLFNWLNPSIPGARCLDAFSGSGALGFEALSRGAEEVIFVEKDAQAFHALENNRLALGATNAIIVNSDFFVWLQAQADRLAADQTGRSKPFDIVFVDPPFIENLHQQAVDALLSANLLSPQALIYVESPASQPAPPPPGWRRVREKCSAGVHYQLLCRD
ncbi:MAG: 16S rRNA (guanine(966)-N(2))-methyltransferase RsmD [Porticoccaceae bacterium]